MKIKTRKENLAVLVFTPKDVTSFAYKFVEVTIRDGHIAEERLVRDSRNGHALSYIVKKLDDDRLLVVGAILTVEKDGSQSMVSVVLKHKTGRAKIYYPTEIRTKSGKKTNKYKLSSFKTTKVKK